MKEKFKRKKRRFWVPASGGFLVLYLVTMGLVTWLVKDKFVEEYQQMFEEIASSLLKSVSEQESLSREEGWDDIKRRDVHQNLVNGYGYFLGTSPSLTVSAAVYDEKKELLVKSSDVIGESVSSDGEKYGPFFMDDYLSFEEKEELAKYHWEEMQSTEDYTLPGKYRISFEILPDGSELLAIYVQKLTWEENPDEKGKNYKDGLTGRINVMETGVRIDYETGEETGELKTFYETGSEVVWEWVNPKICSVQQKKGGVIQTASTVFPYMSSYENWQKWSSSEYLHGYPKKGEFSWKEGSDSPGLVVDSDGFYYRGRYQIQVGMVGEPDAYMEIRMEERPWSAAFAYMKYVYLAGFMLTSACMLLVIHAFNSVYDRQMALEETRRDFTNAAAHELKTPLAIIRNFAENLVEHNMEEKRDYYLSQIISQTEEMDALVVKMIEISKLDSEEMVLKKEKVSISEIIREQMARLEPVLREKRLHVQYREEEDFLLEADREYFSKAVWNLLSNAAEHTPEDECILIGIRDGRCTIENTGVFLEEEEIRHAFDLFFTGDKSRGRMEKHMGLGLSLAEKILRLHGLGLSLENWEEGVRAVIWR